MNVGRAGLDEKAKWEKLDGVKRIKRIFQIFRKEMKLYGNKLIPEDKNQISKSILNKYAKVSESSNGLFKYPTGKSGLEGLNYTSDIREIT